MLHMLDNNISNLMNLNRNLTNTDNNNNNSRSQYYSEFKQEKVSFDDDNDNDEYRDSCMRSPTLSISSSDENNQSNGSNDATPTNQNSNNNNNSNGNSKISSATPKRAKSTFPFGKCKVCNDKATGVHYGVATCEGCKGFFKRSTLRKEKYRCFFGSNCPLMPDNRNRCKACRFRRCLEVGMSIEGVKMGRIPKAEKERALLNESAKQQDGNMTESNNSNNIRKETQQINNNSNQTANINGLVHPNTTSNSHLNTTNNNNNNKYFNSYNTFESPHHHNFNNTHPHQYQNNHQNYHHHHHHHHPPHHQQQQHFPSSLSGTSSSSSSSPPENRLNDLSLQRYNNLQLNFDLMSKINNQTTDHPTIAEDTDVYPSHPSNVSTLINTSCSRLNNNFSYDKSLKFLQHHQNHHHHHHNHNHNHNHHNRHPHSNTLPTVTTKEEYMNYYDSLPYYEQTRSDNLTFYNPNHYSNSNYESNSPTDDESSLVNKNQQDNGFRVRKPQHDNQTVLYSNNDNNNNNSTSSNNNSLRIIDKTKRHSASTLHFDENFKQTFYRYNSYEEDYDRSYNFIKSPSPIIPMPTQAQSPISSTTVSKIYNSNEITLNVLIDEIYGLHMKHNEKVFTLVQQAMMSISLGKTDGNKEDVTIQTVWVGLVESIPQTVKSMIVFAKDMPGIRDLKNTEDFAIIINNRLFDYFMLKHSPLMINGESFMMLPNGIQYTRYWMERVIGKEMCDAIFEFSVRFNELNLTQREKALLFPFALTTHDEALHDQARIQTLHEDYMKALIYEMCSNKRDGAFFTRLSDVLGLLPKLNELQIKNIRSLTPQGTNYILDLDSFN